MPVSSHLLASTLGVTTGRHKYVFTHTLYTPTHTHISSSSSNNDLSIGRHISFPLAYRALQSKQPASFPAAPLHLFDIAAGIQTLNFKENMKLSRFKEIILG